MKPVTRSAHRDYIVFRYLLSNLMGLSLSKHRQWTSIMNVLKNDKRLGTSAPKRSPSVNSLADLMRMAKPVGTFAGTTDFILRWRNGVLVVSDTGDQGGGQN